MVTPAARKQWSSKLMCLLSTASDKSEDERGQRWELSHGKLDGEDGGETASKVTSREKGCEVDQDDSDIRAP